MAHMQRSQGGGGFFVFLVLGLLGSLLLGWVVYPQLLFSKKLQPVDFNHKAHVENAGMACTDCHTYRADGTLKNAIATADCAQCHADVTGGQSPGEKAIDAFVTEYVQKDKKLDWHVYQYQPDNVFFSHFAHQGFECTTCHPDVAKKTSLPPYYENRITGYSSETMKMWQCERCHAELQVANGCYVCHM